jgi:hypothetical protein
LAIEFDCYLIDEVILVGDQNFQRKCHDELFVKRADRALVLASHSSDTIRSIVIARLRCTVAKGASITMSMKRWASIPSFRLYAFRADCWRFHGIRKRSDWPAPIGPSIAPVRRIQNE